MSSTLDPAKLKVVELRAELGARGLDTKGNKPVLVKRLKDALEKELQEGGLSASAGRLGAAGARRRRVSAAPAPSRGARVPAAAESARVYV